ncbi:chromodomain-helicase-DNA-binding protein 8-like [Watersipora subatra]|uniref:chromodomain-helicase-DNA-binding protein 8-like n=1 Tax=Watersipora subatra TaxID=2589382 RepID=UPI00355C95FA
MTVINAEPMPTADSVLSTMQSSPSDAADTKCADPLAPVSEQPVHSPLDSHMLPDDSEELSAALSAIVASQDLTELPPPEPLCVPETSASPKLAPIQHPSISSALLPSSPDAVAAAQNGTSLSSAVNIEPPATMSVDKNFVPVSSHSQIPMEVSAAPPADIITPAKTKTKKSKEKSSKTSKEKSSKTSKKKSKSSANEAVNSGMMQLPPNQQAMPGMPLMYPQQPLMSSQPMHPGPQPGPPNSSAQPIMLVPQSGTLIHPHTTMTVPSNINPSMMASAQPGMPYPQIPGQPVPQGMQIQHGPPAAGPSGMQPVMPHSLQSAGPGLVPPVAPTAAQSTLPPGVHLTGPSGTPSGVQPAIPTGMPVGMVAGTQQGITQPVPVGTGQPLRSIAPRPPLHPVPPHDVQIRQNGPNTAAGVNVHLPELLEDPEFKLGSKASSLPGSLSDAVDSPSMSETSQTPGRLKKSSSKAKSTGKKGRKPGPKRPPASLLKLKKRKRKNSDSMSDSEMSPSLAHTPDSDSFAQRRSGRVTKRQKYVDDLPLDISDDEKDDNSVIQMQSEDTDETPVINQYIVEKLMGHREGTRELELDETEEGKADEEGKEEGKETTPQTIKVTEYYVKYKNFSYLHCDWKTQEELEITDKRVNQKIKRYHQKQSQIQSYMFNLMDEDELFNPEYVEIDRVLGVSRFPPPEGTDEPEAVYYLIKWRQLPYEDATWELEGDVDKSMIDRFLKYANPPENYRRIPMPKACEWKELEENKVYKGDNQLREYQYEGVNWLTFCYYNRQNCILADEMGLGKTVQSIAFLQSIFDYGIIGPFLVIAPLSTIGNWIREFDTWTDLNVIVYHGSSTSRAMIQEYDMFYQDSSGKKRMDVFKFNCLITTYEVIIQDVELLAQIPWRCSVIDEAHRLKNKNCKLMEGLRCFELEHKVLLSGTPLQNNVEELFSLLHFLEPEQFKSANEFLLEFGNLQTEGQVDKLKAILKPMMLRRLKEDVEKNLAPKEETIIEVELTNIQKKYYRAILEKNFSFLTKGGTTANVPNLMNTMMELRKCCNHPYLINGAEEKIVQDLRSKMGSADVDMISESMVNASGKLVLLDKLLPKLKAGNHKVLVFSQMIRVLDIIEDYLIHKKYIYERIDGRIRGNQRQEAIDRFSRPDSDRFVFLLCTRAGGLGINLTAADTCVIYDSDWNPQNDLQAQARCHRIGQKKAVKIYRLICKNTYEREMFDKASLKLGLDKAVLQSMGANKGDPANTNGPAPLSKQEVEQLLKKGAYGALMEDDKEGDQFCEEDIDQILQRRTQVITIESGEKGSTFAKASFSSSGAREDIDINDPEFWQKWAKKADMETDNVKSDLIIVEPRRRKQTKRFGGHGSAQLEEISDLDTSSDSDADDRKLSTKAARGRKSRARKDDDFEIDDNAPPPGCYARPECFKVEKMLLVYGWGRWPDIVKHGGFRRDLDELDVSNISQAILLYSLQHYKGDATIKTFIWDLVMPTENGEQKDIKNHEGLAAPTPRGRKARSRGPRGKKELGEEEDSMDASIPSELSSLDEKIRNCPIDTEMVLSDAGYRKHLIKHSNKVLLRVRMLYYLKQEIIGAQECKVLENTNWSHIDVPTMPKCEGEPPTSWWDKDADKCLLIGVVKHGYEKYNLMRADSCLLFLAVCGPPDKKALRKEQLDDDDDGDKLDEAGNDEDPATPAASTPVPSGTETKTAGEEQSAANKFLPFPSSSDLNTRIRRIVSTFQKMSRRKAEAAAASREKRNARVDRSAAGRIRDFERMDKRNARWTRREESDFYRVISSFGVESTRRGSAEPRRQYIWDTFRQLANLYKKDDDMLTEYLEAFCYMCRRVCNRLTLPDENRPPTLVVEPISEERANRCLSRIDLLNKIREEVLWHESLTKRLTLCQFSPEIPMWWKPGEHDKDLLIGAAKHGLAHTDQHILYDPKLCFKDLYLKSLTEPDKPKQHTVLKLQGKTEGDTQKSSHVESHIKSDSCQPKTDIMKMETDTTMLNGDLHHSVSDTEEPLVKEEVMEEKPSQKVKREISDESETESKASQDVKERSDEKESDLDKTKEPTAKADPEAEGMVESPREEVQERVKTPKEEEIGKVVKSAEEVKPEPFMKHAREAVEPIRSNGLDYYDDRSIPFMWPKDRVVYQRLELVCYCIETGEWPTAAISKRIGGVGLVGTLDTPVGTPDPSRVGTPNHSEYSCAMEEEESESLRLTISRGGASKIRKPKRSRLDLEVDRIARLRDGADSECSQSTPLRGTPDSLMNGSLSSLFADDPNSFAAPRKKRGRKSKAEKEAEARAAVEQTIAASYRKLAELDMEQDTRIPMVDTTDGSRLTGESAPQLKDVERWRLEHPKYMVNTSDLLASSSSSSQGAFAGLSAGSDRKGRRSKHDTPELTESQLASLTGAENVPVIHRETGKKITGSKAPSLLLLQPWLEKNSQYDVDSKWAPVVRHILPDHLKSRIYTDKKKRRREEASSSANSASSSIAAAQAAQAAMFAAAMQAYPMNLGAFGSLPSMGLTPSMMNLYGLGLGADATATDEETAKALAAATSSAHSAFPYGMYNPLLTYSTMLAQGLGMGASPNYAQALSSAGMLNGLLGLDANALAATGVGGELDSEATERIMAMSGMNMAVMEEYARAAAAAGLVEAAASAATTSKEPGERSPAPHNPKPSKASATVTKSQDSGEEEMPEDLSIKPRGEGSAVGTPPAEGRSSSQFSMPDRIARKPSEGSEERAGAITPPLDNPEDRDSLQSEGRCSKNSFRAASVSPRPSSIANSQTLPEGETKESPEHRPESHSPVS